MLFTVDVLATNWISGDCVRIASLSSDKPPYLQACLDGIMQTLHQLLVLLAASVLSGGLEDNLYQDYDAFGEQVDDTNN